MGIFGCTSANVYVLFRKVIDCNSFSTEASDAILILSPCVYCKNCCYWSWVRPCSSPSTKSVLWLSKLNTTRF